MRRPITICLLALSAIALLVLAPAASAAAKKKKGRTPQITRVTPMRVGVGELLTIRGKHFKSKRNANTVIFRAPSGRSAFAKPRRASRTKLVVQVPAAVSRILATASGRQGPTRFKLRVLAGRFSKFTTRRLSPVVTGSGGGGRSGGGGGSGGSGTGGTSGAGGANAACDSGGPGGDHDGDLLANAYEALIKTDPCLRDTDLDGVEDGYEQQSAVDLNHYPATPPLPYPGKRPYPNALDSSDPPTDYDGDGLTLWDEHTLWLRYAEDASPRGGRPAGLAGLVYSDGLKSSRLVGVPGPPLLAWSLMQDPDAFLSDGERDADGDGLGNWDEAHGRMTEAWWPAQHNGTYEPKESAYPGIDFLDNEDTAPAFDAMADGDMDGDGLADGSDDNDHDGLSNMFEVRRPDAWDADAWVPNVSGGFDPGANSWAYTNPFNPCKPYNSERCHDHPPFGYYDGDQRPFRGPDPPAGYPGSAPTTPAG